MGPAGILLIVHIIAGFTALIAAAVATVTKTMEMPHRWHVQSGTVFFWGMAGVFLTAVPLTILRPNTFLFLIAILSFYFALAGWRYARNRRGSPGRLDWVSAGVMVLAGAVMMIFGVFLLSSGDTDGITMLALGAVGTGLSTADLRRSWRGGVMGAERIAQHLTMMLAGAIATITAFVVTNVAMEPAFIAWLAPTVVITPIIIVWSRKIRAGRRVRGMTRSA